MNLTLFPVMMSSMVMYIFELKQQNMSLYRQLQPRADLEIFQWGPRLGHTLKGGYIWRMSKKLLLFLFIYYLFITYF